MKSIIQDGMFTYAIAPQTITTLLGSTPNINISSDSDFICTHIYGVINSATLPPATPILLTMSLASGELFSNVAIDMCAFAKIICPVAGEQQSSGSPILLIQPMRIPANSQINFQITNGSANTIIVQVQLVGYKVQPSNFMM